MCICRRRPALHVYMYLYICILWICRKKHITLQLSRSLLVELKPVYSVWNLYIRLTLSIVCWVKWSLEQRKCITKKRSLKEISWNVFKEHLSSNLKDIFEMNQCLFFLVQQALVPVAFKIFQDLLFLSKSRVVVFFYPFDVCKIFFGYVRSFSLEEQSRLEFLPP